MKRFRKENTDPFLGRFKRTLRAAQLIVSFHFKYSLKWEDLYSSQPIQIRCLDLPNSEKARYRINKAEKNNVLQALSEKNTEF